MRLHLVRFFYFSVATTELMNIVEKCLGLLLFIQNVYKIMGNIYGKSFAAITNDDETTVVSSKSENPDGQSYVRNYRGDRWSAICLA